MRRNNIHKAVTIGFAALFLVFNIGLPIVIHYCEMMGTVSHDSCGMCHTDKNDGNKIELAKAESSCCQSVIAAESNKTVFLQAQKTDITTKLHYSIIPSAIGGLHSSFSIDSQYRSKIFLTSTDSPPLIEDIPIFISSLLI